MHQQYIHDAYFHHVRVQSNENSWMFTNIEAHESREIPKNQYKPKFKTFFREITNGNFLFWHFWNISVVFWKFWKFFWSFESFERQHLLCKHGMKVINGRRGDFEIEHQVRGLSEKPTTASILSHCSNQDDIHFRWFKI